MRYPRITHWSEEHGLYEICIVTETKDGLVRYEYLIQGGYQLDKILHRPIFLFKDWNWIKKHGKLIKKERFFS